MVSCRIREKIREQRLKTLPLRNACVREASVNDIPDFCRKRAARRECMRTVRMSPTFT
jgi:hypothetical protein